MKEETVRLNFEFPKEAHPFLKMVCAQKGISFKEFATELLINAIEEYEDEMLAKKANERLMEIEKNGSENLPWGEACRLAGWNEQTKI